MRIEEQVTYLDCHKPAFYGSVQYPIISRTNDTPTQTESTSFDACKYYSKYDTTGNTIKENELLYGAENNGSDFGEIAADASTIDNNNPLNNEHDIESHFANELSFIVDAAAAKRSKHNRGKA